jgi:acyl-CoA thioester hydrolase
VTTETRFRSSLSRLPKTAHAPTLADFRFRTVEKLRFADTDQNGHVTNSVFAICCQNARMELLCDPRKVPLPCNAQFVIARLFLEFRAEMRWPGAVEVGTRVDHVGRSSVTLAQALFVGELCVAIADSIVALMDKTSRRSIVLPDATAQALSAFSCLSLNDPSRVAAMVVNGDADRSE